MRKRIDCTCTIPDIKLPPALNLQPQQSFPVSENWDGHILGLCIGIQSPDGAFESLIKQDVNNKNTDLFGQLPIV